MSKFSPPNVTFATLPFGVRKTRVGLGRGAVRAVNEIELDPREADTRIEATGLAHEEPADGVIHRAAHGTIQPQLLAELIVELPLQQDLHADPAQVPKDLSLRTLNGLGVPGEGKYMINRYLQERGDAGH